MKALLQTCLPKWPVNAIWVVIYLFQVSLGFWQCAHRVTRFRRTIPRPSLAGIFASADIFWCTKLKQERAYIFQIICSMQIALCCFSKVLTLSKKFWKKIIVDFLTYQFFQATPCWFLHLCTIMVYLLQSETYTNTEIICKFVGKDVYWKRILAAKSDTNCVFNTFLFACIVVSIHLCSCKSFCELKHYNVPKFIFV